MRSISRRCAQRYVQISYGANAPRFNVWVVLSTISPQLCRILENLYKIFVDKPPDLKAFDDGSGNSDLADGAELKEER